MEQYEQNQVATPAVWLITHRFTCQADPLVLQNLLLGLNAHINYDLLLTLYDLLSPEWPHLTTVGRQQRYADHCRVNDIIDRTIDEVQTEALTLRRAQRINNLAEMPLVELFSQNDLL